MNGKKARSLRKEAQLQSIGKPNRKYRVVNASRPVRSSLPINPSGQHAVVHPPGTFALIADCTGSIYQRLKGKRQRDGDA